jgi:hypothetical protein
MPATTGQEYQRFLRHLEKSVRAERRAAEARGLTSQPKPKRFFTLVNVALSLVALFGGGFLAGLALTALPMSSPGGTFGAGFGSLPAETGALGFGMNDAGGVGGGLGEEVVDGADVLTAIADARAASFGLPPEGYLPDLPPWPAPEEYEAGAKLPLWPETNAEALPFWPANNAPSEAQPDW